ADGGRAEAFGDAAAEHQVIAELPAEAELAGTFAAEGRVVRIAAGGAQVELAGSGGVDRDVELEEILADVVLAGRRQRRHAVVLAGHRERVRRVAAIELAVLDTGREGQWTGRQVEQVAGQVGRDL